MEPIAGQQRIPPGQQLVAPGKWPIIGERQPAQSDGLWQLHVDGAVASPTQFSLEDLSSLPQTDITVDIHCVTRWSKLDVQFSGVPLQSILDVVRPRPEANFISFVARSDRRHSTSLELGQALELKTLIALQVDRLPLPVDHGGPIRNIVPGRYFYKSVKWLERIEFLPEDRLGFWESDSGYHNGADPWKEQRYMAPTIDRRTAARLIKSKDFSGRDLRSIDARGHKLDSLNAKSALLRDANFCDASLQKADFSNANLSNAHLRKADLRGAKFVATDLEGADLAGADLRGADLAGCSLIGATFCDVDDESSPVNGAIVDAATVLPADLLEPLAPVQQQYIRSQTG